MPFRIIPDRGQGSENGIQPSTKQRADVLQDCVSGFQFANKAGDFEEQAAAFAGQSKPAPCNADVLAGEPSRDDINGNSIGSKSFCGECSNVIVYGNLRPVAAQHLLRELFDLAECDGGESASALKAEAKAANTCEQIEYAKLAGH
jgi:hypothetical protein